MTKKRTLGWLLLALAQCGLLGSVHAALPPQPPRAQGGAHDDSLAAATALVLNAMGEQRLVLLGEMHGTRETPELVAALLDRLVSAGEMPALALEIARQEQPSVDAYLASSGDEEARQQLLKGDLWQDAMHDGRDSVSMLALLEHVRRLHQTGKAVRVVLFDDMETYAGGVDRDAVMAQNLRAAVVADPDARMLVLTGNMHAMVRPSKAQMVDAQGRPWPAPKTTGAYLADLAPWSLRIDGAEGSMWVCFSTADCGIRPITNGSPQAQPKVDVLGAEEPWDARLLLPRFTASPPAISSYP